VGAERRVPERPVAGQRGVPDTLAGRILTIGSDGFFKEQRGLVGVGQGSGFGAHTMLLMLIYS